MYLCLVERTGERVGRGVLVVKVASGVSIHVMDILLLRPTETRVHIHVKFSNLHQYNILFKL